MTALQQLLDESRGTLALTPGEYEGPLVIRRPCTLDGNNSTLWAHRGPVLIVECPGVAIRNLRVENLSDDPAAVSIHARPDTAFSGVEARGLVKGVPGEGDNWTPPALIELGDFAPDSENSFTCTLHIPSRAALHCALEGIEITPRDLQPGSNVLKITVQPLRNNTILYGEMTLECRLSRRICLSGRARTGAPLRRNHPLSLPGAVPWQMQRPPEIFAPMEGQKAGQTVQQGQRLPLNFAQSSLRVLYAHARSLQPMNVDAYCFLLKGDGKVSGDEDLIFFGNSRSRDGAVAVSEAENTPLISVDYTRLPDWVQRAALCFSVYGDDPKQNFSQAVQPVMHVFSGDEEVFRFPLSSLATVKTVVAAEIYRYKGEWKISFVGSGYQSGLRKLCESYGVHVL